LFLGSEDGGVMFLRKVGFIFNGLHGVISLEVGLFITTAVITSNPRA
jgi:hypothetical protein